MLSKLRYYRIPDWEYVDIIETVPSESGSQVG